MKREAEDRSQESEVSISIMRRADAQHFFRKKHGRGSCEQKTPILEFLPWDAQCKTRAHPLQGITKEFLDRIHEELFRLLDSEF